MKKIELLVFIILSAALSFPFTVTARETTRLEASVVLHFDTGKTSMSTVDKEKLRRFFRKYQTGPKSRVFVVGYTDAMGDRNLNYKLSRKRAQAIRRQIISAFGLDAAVVMAVGKGEENPVADNRSATGRASNRRAEIYLVNTKIRKPDRGYGPKDPYFSQIKKQVRQALELVKKQNIGEALKLLRTARGLGGDHYSDWHAAYGIAGYYAHTSDDEVRAHLNKALQLDPFNFEAREYLGRITARQKVARGHVTPQMGLTLDSAIAITSVAQQYEYLRLFEVEPLTHRSLDRHPVDQWECMTAGGTRVIYYFNHSGIHDWAFGSRPTDKPSPSAHTQSRNADPIINRPAPQASAAKESSVNTVDQDPSKIWESRIFN